MNYAEVTLQALVAGAGMSQDEAERCCAQCIDWLRDSGYSGERVYIPVKTRGVTPAERAEAMRQLQGRLPIADIADLFECSERHVYRAFRREF